MWRGTKGGFNSMNAAVKKSSVPKGRSRVSNPFSGQWFFDGVFLHIYRDFYYKPPFARRMLSFPVPIGICTYTNMYFTRNVRQLIPRLKDLAQYMNDFLQNSKVKKRG